MAQLIACRDAITALDAREADHYGELLDQASQLRDQATQLAGLVTTISRTLADETAALTRLDALDRQVTALTRHLAQPHGQSDSARQPPAAPTGDSDAANGTPADPVAALRDWVERIYRPGYGHLAVLGPCWAQHQLCLYGLDILHQLWSALYLNPDPDDPSSGTDLLSAQAEYQARILPAVAAQLAAETTRCGHPTVPAYPGACL
jgi:hypothetical protein